MKLYFFAVRTRSLNWFGMKLLFKSLFVLIFLFVSLFFLVWVFFLFCFLLLFVFCPSRLWQTKSLRNRHSLLFDTSKTQVFLPLPLTPPKRRKKTEWRGFCHKINLGNASYKLCLASQCTFAY